MFPSNTFHLQKLGRLAFYKETRYFATQLLIPWTDLNRRTASTLSHLTFSMGKKILTVYKSIARGI